MIGRLFSVIGGVVFGLAASQFPEFAQQYEQRLGGAVDELRVIAEKFDSAAAEAGLTRDQALGTYDETENAFLTKQGANIAATLDRYARLKTQLAALENANIVTRVTDMALYYDPDIAAGAMESYNPAVPVTQEGFVYAGVGVLAGYFLFAGLGWAGAKPVRRWQRRRHRPASSPRA